MANADFTLNYTDIKPDPDNVRSHAGVSGIKELATSIKGAGLLNPIIVRPVEDHYVVIAGHRRLAAIGTLVEVGDHDGKIPVILRNEDITQAQVTIEQLVENLQREDISILDEAAGYTRLLEFSMTQAEISRMVGRSKGHVTKRLALIGLPAKAKDKLTKGDITIEAALAIAALDDDELEEFLSNDNWTEYAIGTLLRRSKGKKAAAAMAAKVEALGVPIVQKGTFVEVPEGKRHLTTGVEWSDSWDGVTIPENTVQATWEVASDSARVTFYELGDEAEAPTESNKEAQRKEAEKERKHLERLARKAEVEFLQATLKKVKASDVNEVLFDYALDQIGFNDSREICLFLDLSINTKMENPYGGGEAKEVKDYFGTVREHVTACRESGDIGELRAVVMAWMATRRRDVVLARYEYVPTQLDA